MNKNQFHNHYRQELQSLASDLGLSPTSYSIRSNKGGIAVLGEITLHHDSLYVQVGGSVHDPNDKEQRFMFRSCASQSDYCGGSNRFAPLKSLRAPTTIATFKKIIAKEIPC